MRRPQALPLAAAAAYLLACLLIQSLHLEGSWGGLLMFALALPFSILSLWLSGHLGGLWAFVALNTFWWWALLHALARWRQASQRRTL